MQGKNVAREGWNGKNMFLYLIEGNKLCLRD
ncbi:MW1434 family type I TA system toxin [Bacillus thuringiensis]